MQVQPTRQQGWEGCESPRIARSNLQDKETEKIGKVNPQIAQSNLQDNDMRRAECGEFVTTHHLWAQWKSSWHKHLNIDVPFTHVVGAYLVLFVCGNWEDHTFLICSFALIPSTTILQVWPCNSNGVSFSCCSIIVVCIWLCNLTISFANLLALIVLQVQPPNSTGALGFLTTCSSWILDKAFLDFWWHILLGLLVLQVWPRNLGALASFLISSSCGLDAHFIRFTSLPSMSWSIQGMTTNSMTTF